jgi:hypothetical protein
MTTELRTARTKVAVPDELVKALTAEIAKKGGPQAPASIPASRMRSPLVTAIMVVSDARRLRFARVAVTAFANQTYTNKHLVIVNGIDPASVPGEETANRAAVLTGAHPWVTEIAVPPGLTVGAMRNRGIEALDPSCQWAILWEDDNFAHQSRIAFQMSHRTDAPFPVMLRRELRLDVVNSVAVPHESPTGIHSTLLFPVPVVGGFPDKSGYDDAEFWVERWGGRQVVVPNIGEFPQTVMQLAFWHGLNLSPRDQFFGKHADAEWYGRAVVTEKEAEYLRSVSSLYGATFVTEKVASPSVANG